MLECVQLGRWDTEKYKIFSSGNGQQDNWTHASLIEEK